MPDSQPAPLTARQRKGIIVGVALIAWGIIGALVSYLIDSNSLDLISMIDASENATVHAVIWTVVGAAVIFWFLTGPGSSPDACGDDDEDQGAKSE